MPCPSTGYSLTRGTMLVLQAVELRLLAKSAFEAGRLC